MTLAELEQFIAEARMEGATDDTDVILGTQSHYPFGNSATTCCLDQGYHFAFTHGEVRQCFVIAEGSQQGYGNKAWWSGDAVIEGELDDPEQED